MINTNNNNFEETETKETATKKITEILSRKRILINDEPETAWDVLVNNNILSRGVPLPLDDSRNYREDWSKIIYDQIVYVKEFLATSVRFGLGMPPLNEEDSLVALAVYNATVEWNDLDEEEVRYDIGIPSTRACFQEFWKLLIQK